MDIEAILKEYDAMYGRNSLAEIEEYLMQKMAEAKSASDVGALFTLLNEAVGFFRDTTQKEKALKCCGELLALLEIMGLAGSYEYATALLNIANAYRAFGLFEESLAFFETTLQIYEAKVPAGDFAYANLYNNWSLLYQEMCDFSKAAEMLEKALEIVNSYEGAVVQQAVTHSNLAASLLQIGTEETYQSALEHLHTALDIFEADGGQDFHYGAALVAMGDACSVKANYKEAAEYYASGLRELEKHVGKTDNYARVLEKYQYVKALVQKEFAAESKTVAETTDSAGMWKSNMERSRAFYEQYGAPMIHNQFPEYEERIAVGLVGEGSDCYGFDDEISTDHDYEVGFCMWLMEKDFAEIGEKLQDAYGKLMRNVVWDQRLGEPVRCEYGVEKPEMPDSDAQNRFLGGRRGVFAINAFYNQLLGTRANYETGQDLFDYHVVQEFQLAAATNGEVFRDDAGIFSRVRGKLLAYYPERVWYEKLAGSLHEYAQYAQSNYARMMARRDLITANLCIGKAVESAMDLLYLLKRQYAPYYKWKRKGLEQSLQSSQQAVLGMLEKIVALPPQTHAWENAVYDAGALNLQDECIQLFEQVAALILQEMKRQGLVDGRDVFLENYVGQMMKNTLVDKIVELEWKQFDKVKNEGGRADCQDNFPTFSIMRKSQYLAWQEELLNSYCNDLLEAEGKGWNLIMEKYARMMKSTAPAKYAELEGDLPTRSPERIAISEEIIRIQVAWMEEFAAKYPKMADNARSIRTEEDTEYNTSYETYLRGELGTYSESTFVLYGKFVAQLAQAGRNLAYEIMENTAHLYGYDSVEDAESRL